MDFTSDNSEPWNKSLIHSLSSYENSAGYLEMMILVWEEVCYRGSPKLVNVV